jgi:hypothetical protein
MCDQHLQRQVERGQRCGRHHRRSRSRIAEDHDLGVAQLKARRPGLAAVVDHREQLDPVRLPQPRDAGDGVVDRHRARLRRDHFQIVLIGCAPAAKPPRRYQVRGRHLAKHL